MSLYYPAIQLNILDFCLGNYTICLEFIAFRSVLQVMADSEAKRRQPWFTASPQKAGPSFRTLGFQNMVSRSRKDHSIQGKAQDLGQVREIQPLPHQSLSPLSILAQLTSISKLEKHNSVEEIVIRNQQWQKKRQVDPGAVSKAWWWWCW